MIADGRPVFRNAAAHAWAVSLASIGRITSSPGIARRLARCSIGWWVGPSSPTPIESWDHTKMVGIFCRAANRTAPRM